MDRNSLVSTKPRRRGEGDCQVPNALDDGMPQIRAENAWAGIHAGKKGNVWDEEG